MLSALFKKIVQLFRLFLDWLSPLRKRPTGILAEIEEALRDWRWARETINYADSDMIDYAIYNLNATEKRFTGLLKKAREAGLTAWKMENPNSKTHPEA